MSQVLGHQSEHILDSFVGNQRVLQLGILVLLLRELFVGGQSERVQIGVLGADLGDKTANPLGQVEPGREHDAESVHLVPF